MTFLVQLGDLFGYMPFTENVLTRSATVSLNVTHVSGWVMVRKHAMLGTVLQLTS